MIRVRELEDKIKEIIEQTYCCIFTGKVEVILLSEDTYSLRLILNNFYVPLNITKQGTQEEFLELIQDEIYKRRLFSTEYYTGYKNEQG